MENNIQRQERIIRLKDVLERTGLGKSAIYEMMSIEAFPQKITLGKRCVGWVESEVDAWILMRIEKSRAFQK